MAPARADETEDEERDHEQRQSDEPQPRSDKHFGLISYPNGVAYTGMLMAGEATGDQRFIEFTTKRFQFMADNLPYIFLWYPQEIDVINANLQGVPDINLRDNGIFASTLEEFRR